jgi:hypothetical protein
MASSLHNNLLVGFFLEDLGNYTNLQALFLDNNLVLGHFLSSFRSLKAFLIESTRS